MTAPVPPEARLANDLARQFGHLPEAEAVARIATHVQRFWEPRMRERLRVLAGAGDPSLDPLVRAAAATL